jgi:hypothetical protein
MKKHIFILIARLLVMPPAAAAQTDSAFQSTPVIKEGELVVGRTEKYDGGTEK